MELSLPLESGKPKAVLIDTSSDNMALLCRGWSGSTICHVGAILQFVMVGVVVVLDLMKGGLRWFHSPVSIVYG